MTKKKKSNIKMSLTDSEAQATSTTSACESVLQYMTNVKQVMTIIDNEITQNMKGKGIDSLTNFISSLILPYIDSVALVIHEIDEAMGKLPTKYTSEVDSKSWSEEELQKKIDEYNSKVEHLRNILSDTNVKMSDSKKIKKSKRELADKTRDSLDAAMIAAEKYYELLDKLREYDTNSETVFGSVSEFKSLSKQGKIAITGGYDSKKINILYQKIIKNGKSLLLIIRHRN